MIPSVLVQRCLDNWNDLELVDPCPFCGGKHRHSTDLPPDFGIGLGTRQAHCYRGSYALVEARNKRRLEIEAQLDKALMVYDKMPVDS